jgi:hypothetical protein
MTINEHARYIFSHILTLQGSRWFCSHNLQNHFFTAFADGWNARIVTPINAMPPRDTVANVSHLLKRALMSDTAFHDVEIFIGSQRVLAFRSRGERLYAVRMERGPWEAAVFQPPSSHGRFAASRAVEGGRQFRAGAPLALAR